MNKKFLFIIKKISAWLDLIIMGRKLNAGRLRNNQLSYRGTSLFHFYAAPAPSPKRTKGWIGNSVPKVLLERNADKTKHFSCSRFAACEIVPHKPTLNHILASWVASRLKLCASWKKINVYTQPTWKKWFLLQKKIRKLWNWSRGILAV